jgi:hypothetical protein
MSFINAYLCAMMVVTMGTALRLTYVLVMKVTLKNTISQTNVFQRVATRVYTPNAQLLTFVHVCQVMVTLLNQILLTSVQQSVKKRA